MTGSTRAAAAGLAVAIIVIYALRLDSVAGLIVDDAWYILLAKALAQGEGYRLISSALTPIQPVVPPGFPAILAPVFWLNPSFPDNLIWLKVISVLAMLGAGAVYWMDLTRHRDVSPANALMLTSAMLIVPAFVFLATSTVMAECVFTLVQLLVIFLIERTVRERMDANGVAVAAGVAGAIGILLRIPGVAMVAAAIVYLALARRWRQAAVFGVTVVVCVAPWFLYSRAHEPTLEERLAHGGSMVSSYSHLVALRRPGDSRSGEISMPERIARGVRNLAGIASRDTGGVLVPAFYRGPNESGQELLSMAGGTPEVGSMGRGAAIATVSLVVTLIILAGWIGARREWLSMPVLWMAASIVMIATVGSQTFRYIVPLTPFLLLLFWRGLRSGAVARIVMLCLIGLNFLDHGLYIQQKATSTTDWLADAAEVEELLAWMNGNLTAPGAVASGNPALVYLRTGRKGVYIANLANRAQWESVGVRYIAAMRPSTEPPPDSMRPRQLFRTVRGRLWVVEIFSGQDR